MADEKRKVNPRVIMGVCSGIAYVAAMGIQAYRFGWEDVPEYWFWAGGGAAVILIAWAALARSRDRRQLREAIDRSALRLEAQRREGPGGGDPPSINNVDRSSQTD